MNYNSLGNDASLSDSPVSLSNLLTIRRSLQMYNVLSYTFKATDFDYVPPSIINAYNYAKNNNLTPMNRFENGFVITRDEKTEVKWFIEHKTIEMMWGYVKCDFPSINDYFSALEYASNQGNPYLYLQLLSLAECVGFSYQKVNYTSFDTWGDPRKNEDIYNWLPTIKETIKNTIENPAPPESLVFNNGIGINYRGYNEALYVSFALQVQKFKLVAQEYLFRYANDMLQLKDQYDASYIGSVISRAVNSLLKDIEYACNTKEEITIHDDFIGETYTTLTGMSDEKFIFDQATNIYYSIKEVVARYWTEAAIAAWTQLINLAKQYNKLTDPDAQLSAEDIARKTNPDKNILLVLDEEKTKELVFPVFRDLSVNSILGYNAVSPFVYKPEWANDTKYYLQAKDTLAQYVRDPKTGLSVYEQKVFSRPEKSNVSLPLIAGGIAAAYLISQAT